MQPDDEFRVLIRRVRAGDPDAAAELLRRYEPEVRRAVHMRLTSPGLRRLLDSTDICQSVFAAFYVRAAAGDFDLEHPADLLRLLVRMAANRITDHARRHNADRRDQRRQTAGSDAALRTVADSAATPAQVVADRDLLRQVLDRLSAEHRYLAQQRAEGREWAELACELGQSADALRMRLRRAVREACAALNLGDDADE